MEKKTKTGPEPEPEPAAKFTVGITYNLKKGIAAKAEDSEAEYDNIETVLAIQHALETAGCHVVLMEADESLPGRLKSTPVNMVFNIAEGRQGRGREAEVPALLNLMNIPFTGSDETTLCLALDKALTKRLLSTYRIRTPKYRVISKNQPHISGRFSFPCIVKPNAEGSSKGIPDVCIAANREELTSLVKRNIELYDQDMLVEEYIHGREFTVGLLGNGSELRVFPPMEIIYLDKQSKYNIYSFNVKKNYKKLIRYESPAKISKETEAEMVSMARKIFEILSCRDFARVDFRLSEDGRPYFIEINPLPGLAPGYSDFPMLAAFHSVDYVPLVRGIFDAAVKRYGLPFGM